MSIVDDLKRDPGDGLAQAAAEAIEQARMLILSATLHMLTYPEGEARNSWLRDSERWLAQIQG